MIFIKNIKIFVISVLSMAVYVQARSVSQIGDIRVETSGGKILNEINLFLF